MRNPGHYRAPFPGMPCSFCQHPTEEARVAPRFKAKLPVTTIQGPSDRVDSTLPAYDSAYPRTLACHSLSAHGVPGPAPLLFPTKSVSQGKNMLLTLDVSVSL